MRKIILALIACLGLSCGAVPQQVVLASMIEVPASQAKRIKDLEETVVPIAHLKPLIIPGSPDTVLYPRPGIGIWLGTGFCLDPDCRFVATAYHIAALAPARKIKGDKIVRRYFATGPHDHDATLQFVHGAGAMFYNPNRDLAIFELRRPLRHHHGLDFSFEELQRGQKVEIFGYVHERLHPFRELRRFPATFKGETETGMLTFDYEFYGNTPIIGGESGGIVVDSKTHKIVGILTGASNSTERIAEAVPVETLAEFVSEVLPFLAAQVFPSRQFVSPVPGDFYPKFVPTHVDALQHRPEEPHEVSVLRGKAQLLADSMRKFIALQTFAWGSGNNEPAAEAWYEIQVLDGLQRFRRYPGGKKELEHPPLPRLSGWVLPSDEWSELPKRVGTELRLKVHQAADVVVNGRRMKVFQYYASVEDNLCLFEPVTDFVLFTVGKTVAVACYGEVWTDQDTNIVRISEHLDLSAKLKAYRGWDDLQIVLTYGWYKIANEPPKLVPLTIFTEVRYKKRIYWCRGNFTDYHVFSAQSRVLSY